MNKVIQVKCQECRKTLNVLESDYKMYDNKNAFICDDCLKNEFVSNKIKKLGIIICRYHCKTCGEIFADYNLARYHCKKMFISKTDKNILRAFITNIYPIGLRRNDPNQELKKESADYLKVYARKLITPFPIKKLPLAKGQQCIEINRESKEKILSVMDKLKGDERAEAEYFYKLAELTELVINKYTIDSSAK